MSAEAMADAVETLARRFEAVLDVPGPKYDRFRARLERFRGRERRFGRAIAAEALRGLVSTDAARVATMGAVAIADHSSGLIRRWLEQEGFPEPVSRRGGRLQARKTIAAVRRLRAVRAVLETRLARAPAGFDRALRRYALVELMESWLAYAARDVFADIRGVLIVDDLSPSRMAMGFAAAGRPVGCAVMTSGARAVPPFPLAVAACVEEAQRALYHGSLTCLRPTSRRAMIATVRPSYAVGVVFNGKTDEHMVRMAHDALSAHPRCARASLRLHPAFRPARPLGDVNLGDQASLEDFVRAHDIIVCGNSGSLIEIALMGAPVVFSDRIDHNPHDRHGFVGRGLVLEDRSPLDAIDLDAAVAFYASDAWRARLAAAYPPEGADVVADRKACLTLLAAG